MTGKDDSAAQYRRYAQLVHRWNQRIRLTAARSVDEILAQHVADSCAVLPHVPEDVHTLLDVGAGAGFPGLVIAIARPEIAVVLLEPVHKKRAFLATAARELQLGRVTARAERLEDHRARATYDVAVSRATWPVREWIAKAEPYVRPGGRILAMEGREQTELPGEAQRHRYRLGDRTRAVIVVHI